MIFPCIKSFATGMIHSPEKFSCTQLHAWNFHTHDILSNIFISMHGNFIFVHGNFIFMHGNFIFILGNFIFMLGNFIFIHEMFMPRFLFMHENFSPYQWPGRCK